MEKSRKKLPAGWEMKTLKEIGVTQTGNTPATNDSENWGDFIPFVKPAHFNIDGTIDSGDSGLSEHGLKSARLFSANSILMVCIGATIGKTGFSRIRVTSNQQINCLTPFENLEPKFFYYALISDQFQQKVLQNASQATLPIINKSKWENLSVIFPTCRSEQQRIVTKLDEAFAEIAAAKANIERNLQNCKEVFQSELNTVFANKGKEWKEKKLGDLSEVIGGYSFKSEDFKEEGKYQVIRMGNVRPGVIREDEKPVYIDEIDDKTLNRALLLPNDVIITQTGTRYKRDYGFTVIIEKDNYLLNQRISAIRFTKDYLSKFFLYFSWTDYFRNQYFAKESGTVGQGNVGINAIIEAKVPILNIDKQQFIVEELDALSSQCKQMEQIYQQKLSSLEELKKSILQKAFSGEL